MLPLHMRHLPTSFYREKPSYQWTDDERRDVWVNAIALMKWGPVLHITAQYHIPKSTEAVRKDTDDFRSRIRNAFPHKKKSQWVFTIEHGERWEEKRERRKSDERKNRHCHILIKDPEGSPEEYEKIWTDWRQVWNQELYRPASIEIKEIDVPSPDWDPMRHAGMVMESQIYLENACLYLFKESTRNGFWIRQHHRVNYHGE